MSLSTQRVLRSQVSNLKLLSSHNMAYVLHPPWGHLAEWLGEGKSQRNLRHIAFFKVTKMTNLDNILKGRDITLLTNVHLVKSLAFPIVIYGCESWTIKKAER